MIKRKAFAPEQPKRRCAIYVRKSTSHGLDKEYTSLEAQREACEQYIAARAGDGWVLVDRVYEDGGYSGKNIDRPGFQRLLADIAAGEIDIVVVHRLDRLSRSLLDFARIMEAFAESGAAFVSVTQNFSTADPMGRLVLNILMTFAEFEREMICARTRDKMRANRRRGKWTGGVTPFGYRLADAALYPDPEAAPCVQRMFDLYLETFSANQVATALNRGDWPRPRSSRLGWTKNAVLRILTSPVYAGLLRVGEDEFADGEHEALVGKITWKQVQDHLAGLRRGEVVRSGSAYLLAGILRCGACDTKMVGATTTKGQTKYRYYRCQTRDKKGAAACPSGHIAAGPLEESVTGLLQQRLRAAELEHDIVDAVNAEFDAERDRLRSQQTSIAQRMAHLAAARHSIFTDAPDPSSAAVARAVEDNEAATAVAKRERLALDEQLDQLAVKQVSATQVAKMLQRLDQVWSHLTPENRARVVRAAITDVKLNRLDSNFDITFPPFLASRGENRHAIA